MFRERAKTLQGISLSLDVLCICAAFGASFLLRYFHEQLPLLGRVPALAWTAERFVRSDYAVLLAVSVLAWVTSMRVSGVYLSHRSESYLTIFHTYLRALTLAVLATAATIFVLKMGSISRIFFGYYFATAFVFLVAKQFSVIGVLHQMRRSGLNKRHALVIGAGKPASWLASVIREATETGYDLVGLLLTGNGALPETSVIPVVGRLSDLDAVMLNHPVDEVFIVGGAQEIAQLAPTAQKLIERGRVVSLITPLSSGQHGVRGRVTEFSGVPMLSFGPMPKDEVRLGMKRVTDIAVSATALVVLSPLMGLLAAIIKLSDGGPALFSQERLGVEGARFKLYKFRSMRADAEKLLAEDPALHRRYVEGDYKLPEDEDPRISRLGRFLRQSSLDELPQLWNVLKGDMTLVGPRPIVPDEIERYEPYADLFLSVRPGITGQWQVGGRSDVQYPERAFMDFDYIGGQSVISDLEIMARTVPSVLRRRGAH